MKSFFNVAPELPPPPYTWLITTLGNTVGETTSRRGARGEVFGAVTSASLPHAMIRMPTATPAARRIAEGRTRLDLVAPIIGPLETMTRAALDERGRVCPMCGWRASRRGGKGRRRRPRMLKAVAGSRNRNLRRYRPVTIPAFVSRRAVSNRPRIRGARTSWKWRGGWPPARAGPGGGGGGALWGRGL